mmetsp:Transcript_47649/g.113206  ORF Transcript_47649/g.113206 Transcript_47649/m.113206 type:complete len:251 (+) Transcript_47649:1812-2564(+)
MGSHNNEGHRQHQAHKAQPCGSFTTYAWPSRSSTGTCGEARLAETARETVSASSTCASLVDACFIAVALVDAVAIEVRHGRVVAAEANLPSRGRPKPRLKWRCPQTSIHIAPLAVFPLTASLTLHGATLEERAPLAATFNRSVDDALHQARDSPQVADAIRGAEGSWTEGRSQRGAGEAAEAAGVCTGCPSGLGEGGHAIHLAMIRAMHVAADWALASTDRAGGAAVVCRSGIGASWTADTLGAVAVGIW